MVSLPSQEQDWRRTPPAFNPYHLELITSVFAIVLAIFIGRALFEDDDRYGSNVYMTVLGVIITILFLDRQAERRDRQREENDLKTQLIRDASSTVNDVARNAVDQLNKRDWLRGDRGLLIKANLTRANLTRANLTMVNLEAADLTRANLTGANLTGADLTRAKLMGANLEAADLTGANLTGANLEAANLTRANLSGTDLTGANLTMANLTGADLTRANLTGSDLIIANLTRAKLMGANLSGTNLTMANLIGTTLIEAKFTEKTKLLDGTNWTPDTDLTKFTNPPPDKGDY